MGGGWNMWGIDSGVLVTGPASTPGLPVRLGHSQLPSPLLGGVDLACNGPLNSSWDFKGTLNKFKVNIAQFPQTWFCSNVPEVRKGPRHPQFVQARSQGPSLISLLLPLTAVHQKASVLLLPKHFRTVHSSLNALPHLLPRLRDS